MTTQNKNNGAAKRQPTNAPNKGASAVEQNTDRSSRKGGAVEEKRKGDMKPIATGKVQNTAKTGRDNTTDRTKSTKKH